MRTKLALLLVLGFIATGCPITENPYYSEFKGHGLEFKNDFGLISGCQAPFYGVLFDGIGNITNTNSFDVRLEANRHPILVLGRDSGALPLSTQFYTVKAGQSVKCRFTGGDTFKIKKLSGEPVGVVRANVLFRKNGIEKTYIGK